MEQTSPKLPQNLLMLPDILMAWYDCILQIQLDIMVLVGPNLSIGKCLFKVI